MKVYAVNARDIDVDLKILTCIELICYVTLSSKMLLKIARTIYQLGPTHMQSIQSTNMQKKLSWIKTHFKAVKNT